MYERPCSNLDLIEHMLAPDKCRCCSGLPRWIRWPGLLDEAVEGEAPGGAEEAESADVLEPAAEGRLAGEGAAADDLADSCQDGFGQLGDDGLASDHA